MEAALRKSRATQNRKVQKSSDRTAGHSHIVRFFAKIICSILLYARSTR